MPEVPQLVFEETERWAEQEDGCATGVDTWESSVDTCISCIVWVVKRTRETLTSSPNHEEAQIAWNMGGLCELAWKPPRSTYTS